MKKIDLPDKEDSSGNELFDLHKKHRSLQKQGKNVNLMFETIKNNTQIGIVYRQNEFLDKIVESIEQNIPVEVTALKIPKGKDELDEKQKKFIESFVELYETTGKAFLDATTTRLARVYSGNQLINHRSRKDESLSPAKRMEKNLQELGRIAVEEYNLENIVLVSGSEGKYKTPMRLAEHGLNYITANGEEKHVESYDGGLDIIDSNEDYREVIDFFKNNLEKYGAKIFIGVEEIQNSDDRRVDVYESDVEFDGGYLKKQKADIDLSKTAILLDRHQNSEELSKYAAVFLKHENETIEDQTSTAYVGDSIDSILKDISESIGIRYPSEGLIKDFVCKQEKNLGYQDVTEFEEIESDRYLAKLMNENGYDKGHDSLYLVRVKDGEIEAEQMITTESTGDYIHLDFMKPEKTDNKISVEYKGEKYTANLD